ncbi:MAG: hypothetical protein Q4G33_13020 [bacterium]|nr:hypothetical protein [bacterium]
MNMEKLVSSVAAFAMTASAFAGLTVSAAETVTSYDFEDGNALFAEDSRITVGVADDEANGSKVATFTCAKNAQNGYSFAHYDFSSLVEDATATKIEFDYYNTNGGRAILSLGSNALRGTTGNSSKTTYSSTGAAFNLGSDKSNSILNNVKGTLADYTDKWMHVVVDVDEIANKYSYTIDGTKVENVSFLDANVSAITQIDIFGYINNSLCAKIDNLSITKVVDDTIKTYGVTFTEKNGVNATVTVNGSDVTSGAELVDVSMHLLQPQKAMRTMQERLK